MEINTESGWHPAMVILCFSFLQIIILGIEWYCFGSLALYVQ